MRRTVRHAAVGLGALALAVGAAGCGFGDDGSSPEGEGQAAEEAEEEPTEAEQDQAEGVDDGAVEDSEADTDDEGDADATTDDESTDDDADGEDAEAGNDEVTDEDLSAAKQQFLGFVEALGEQDAEAACGFTLNPATNEPFEGDLLDMCAEALEDSEQMDVFTPELAAMVTEDMLEAEDNGDGTISLSVPDANMDMTMVKGNDGEWYLSN